MPRPPPTVSRSRKEFFAVYRQERFSTPVVLWRRNSAAENACSPFFPIPANAISAPNGFLNRRFPYSRPEIHPRPVGFHLIVLSMQDDSREPPEEAADVSFADILKEFEAGGKRPSSGGPRRG